MGSPTFDSVMAARLGWTQTTTSLSAAGYVTAGVGGPFSNAVAAAIIAHNPDVVMLEGGINDTNRGYAAGVVQAAVSSLLATIRASLPTQPIYVVAPYTPRAAYGLRAWLLEVAGEIQAAIAGLPNVIYLDCLTVPWITGTGYVTAPTGDGNADVYTSADGTHTSKAGER